MGVTSSGVTPSFIQREENVKLAKCP